eukprot:TRINITY_DN695_c0_g1_i4.p1 TRINITY_DN695_c0_g1~~TRINITY_DN695_c0_g1_i4.p1  ORF type:complete len:561 (-),score=136.44 TRINITY_DN695_c0_g1_i4:552-2234(-)
MLRSFERQCGRNLTRLEQPGPAVKATVLSMPSPQPAAYWIPVLNVNMQELNSLEDLSRTTLQAKGLVSGSMVIRLMMRYTGIPMADALHNIEEADAAFEALKRENAAVAERAASVAAPPALAVTAQSMVQQSSDLSPTDSTRQSQPLSLAEMFARGDVPGTPAVVEVVTDSLTRPVPQPDTSAKPQQSLAQLFARGELPIPVPVQEKPRTLISETPAHAQPVRRAVLPERQQSLAEMFARGDLPVAMELDHAPKRIVSTEDVSPLDWEERIKRAQSAADGLSGGQGRDYDQEQMELEAARQELRRAAELREAQRLKHRMPQRQHVKETAMDVQDAQADTVQSSPLDRQVVVLKRPQGTSIASIPELPESFYEINAGDVARVRARLKQSETEPMLKTKAVRDREAATTRRVYDKTTIRVIFPDELILQVCFRPSEREGDLCNFVRQSLASDQPFILYTTPPVEPLNNTTQTLFARQLVPAANVYFRWADPTFSGPMLRDDLAQTAREIVIVEDDASVQAAAAAEDAEMTEVNNTEGLELRGVPAAPTSADTPKHVPKWFKR